MYQISILIPTYNRPERVIEAIESCIAQTYPPFEIVVGDDSPNTLTQEAVSKISKSTKIPITYLKRNATPGQVTNVNRLFKMAKGDKLMLLHDDDLIVPQALTTLVDCFKSNSKVQVAYGKQYIIAEEGTISIARSEGFNKSFYRTKEYEGMKLTSLEAGITQQFPNDAYLIDSELAREVKYNDVGDACDFDFGLRVGQTGCAIYYVDAYTAKYRVSDESISQNPLYNSAITAYLRILNLAVPESSLALKRRWLIDRAGVAAGQAISTKNYKVASSIIFSRYHFGKNFTAGGINRIIKLLIGIATK